MTLSTVEAAERGHPKAIAATIRHVAIQQKLAAQLNIRAFYKPKGEHLALIVVIRTETPPNAALCVKVVRRIIQRFSVHRFVPRAIVHGLVEDRQQPVWSKVIALPEWSAETAIAPLGFTPAPNDDRAELEAAGVSDGDRPADSEPSTEQTDRRSERGFRWRNVAIMLAIGVGVMTLFRALAGVFGGGMVGMPNAIVGLVRPVTRLVSQQANSALAGMQPELDQSLPTDWSRLLPTIETPLLPPELTRETVTIAAVGDIVPGTDFPDVRLPAQPDDLFTPTADALRSADLTFGNFESVLTTVATPTKDVSQPGTFAFRAPPYFAKSFQMVGFDILNVANNHSYDFGDRGLDDTYRHFNEAGIDVIGDRTTILVRQVKDVSIAFLAFSPYDAHNSVNDLDRARAIVEEADDYADVIVVSMHIGAEGADAQRVTGNTEMYFGEDRGNPREFARAVVDAGADLVLGHGPHVLRAIEVYKGRAIAYSLGNFVGYGALSNAGDTQYSTILKAELASDGELLDARLIPISLAGDGIPRIDPDGAAIERVRSLTQSDFPDTPIEIHNDGQITVSE